MQKKFFLLIFIFFILSCKKEKYFLDFIFLWKENCFKKFYNISHLGMEKNDDSVWANSGEISSLKFKQNQKISIELKLGKDPFFSFYPLTNISEGDFVIYKVLIYEKDKLKKDFKFKLNYKIPPAPQRILVNLKQFSEKNIKMVLSGSCEKDKDKDIVLGSPFIIHKLKKIIKNFNDKNFILISIDTLRADALGIYGRNSSITPNIDYFSKKSDLWLNCYSTSNKTNPSFCSILSGLYLKHHGIYTLVDPLPKNILTLPEIFKDYCYETIAVVSAFHLHSGANLCRRFSKYKVSEKIFSTEEAVFEAINYLKNTKDKFFLWLHIFDPHTPHTAPEPFFSGYYATKKFDYFPFNYFNKSRKEGHLNYVDKYLLANPEMYYDEVSYMDFSLGFLFNFLESNGYYNNSIIAFISDHGENLNEHGNIADHGGLWETTTHIPLILKIPKKENHQIYKHLVQSIDLFPTILRLFNFKSYQNDGVDLYPEYTFEKRKFVFAEALEDNEIMVRNKNYLFKINKKDGFINTFLFDSISDPKEILNISEDKEILKKNFIGVLNLFLKDKIKYVHNSNLSVEEIKKLKSLGYLY